MKRTLDVIVAALGLVGLSPVLGVVAASIRATMGSPVLFRQVRPGLHGEPFVLYKFRTMRHPHSAAENGGARASADPDVLDDDERLTNLGRFLRSTSLDELPELWNVLTGDMSLVGPRPLLMEYLDLYTPRQARRHEVRPGITGWAQVNGRNDMPWGEKLEHDVWYVEHRSVWLDLRILARTVWAVITRRGISRAGHATAPKFTGDGSGG